tara:strand:- start:269 stop:613 length:345 start_codon:yes stop_codon:yes gene_type:complete
MTKETLLNNIATIKGIGPKVLQKIESEIDNYEEENKINLPYCSDFKIEFYNKFGYDGLENAEKSGEVSAYGVFWDDTKGIISIADILSSYGELTRNQDSYSGAVVTLEFCALND